MADTEEELILWKKWLDIKAFFRRKEEQWKVISLEMRFYVAGFMVVLLSTIAIVMGLPKDLFQCIFTLGFVAITIGFLIETYFFVMTFLATTLGKVVATFLLALAIALANGMAQLIINNATGFDPAYFSGTRAFVTPLMVMYFVIFGSILLFLISICSVIVVALYDLCRLPFTKRNSIEQKALEFKLIGHALRFFGALCLSGISQSGWNYIQKPYEHSLDTVAARFTYTFEMFPDKSCFADKKIHIKRISDRLVLVGESRGGKHIFQTLACPIDPEQK